MSLMPNKVRVASILQHSIPSDRSCENVGEVTCSVNPCVRLHPDYYVTERKFRYEYLEGKVPSFLGGRAMSHAAYCLALPVLFPTVQPPSRMLRHCPPLKAVISCRLLPFFFSLRGSVCILRIMGPILTNSCIHFCGFAIAI